MPHADQAVIHPPERLAALRESGLSWLPEASFDRLTRLAARLLNAPVALVTVLEPDRQLLKSVAGLGEPWTGRREIPLEHSFCREATDPDAPLVIEDARVHPRLRESPTVVENGWVAYAGVPLTAAGQVLGTLCVLDLKPRRWSDEEIQTLRDLAGSAQGEIDLRRAERQGREGQAYLRAVVEAQQEVARAGLDLGSVLGEIVHRARRLTGAHAAVVEVPEGDEMVYRAVSGTAEAHAGTRLRRDGSISGLCLRLGDVLRSDDTEHDPRVDRDACRRVGARSLVVVPLRGTLDTAGVLKVYSSEPGAFAEPHVHSLRLMAGLLAFAMDNARLFSREQQLALRLSESEQLYRSIFEGAAEGLLLVDREEESAFRYVAANAAFSRITGLAADEVVGRTPGQVLPPGAAERAAALYARVLQSGEPVEATHSESFPRGRVTTRTRVHPVATPDGAVRRMVVLTEDVTERVQASQKLEAYSRELERSNRELQEFASVASHDLQEPLRKIQVFGGRLVERFADGLGEQGGEYVRRMQAAAARMQHLIDDLLAYSRVGTRAPETAPADLGRIAREVIADLQVRIEQTGAAVELGELPAVIADPLQMRQLLQNLVANALKFHPQGVPPAVRIAGNGLPGDRVEIRVEDDGIGIDAAFADRIFGPFERLHPRGEFEGTGMGLAICRKIAERHGGGITVRSAPGRGSTFVVTLPRNPPIVEGSVP